MKSLIIVLLISIAYAGMIDRVQFASGGNICAATTPRAEIFIGKKGNSECTNEDRPEEYIQMKMRGLAFLKDGDSAYLRDRSLVNIIEKGEPTRLWAERDVVHTDENGNESTFAFMTAGRWMGEEDCECGKWGYVGMAAYLCQTGEISYKTNRFLVHDRVVNDVCVVDVGEDGECIGDEVTARPGTFKFSLYGYTNGNDYENWASDYTHLALRQKVEVSGMGGDAADIVTFNGDKDLYSLGSESVNTIRIQGVNTYLEYDFVTKYNVGKSIDRRPVPQATHDIVIHAKPDGEDAGVFYLDYVFELTDGLDERLGYFVYDPEVRVNDVQEESESVDDDQPDEGEEDSAGTLTRLSFILLAVLLAISFKF